MIIVKQEEIKIVMAKAGFTGTGLAEATQLSQSYITQLLNNKRNVSPPVAKRICQVLNCTFDDIFSIKKLC